MPVTGCMMPATGYANVLFDGSGVKPHTRDGLSINFEFGATVSDPTACIVERFGCTDSEAYNYDPYATVNYDCYPVQQGCLDNSFQNYNCSAIGYDDSNAAFVTYSSACTTLSPRVTTHQVSLCASNGISPPPPPGSGGKVLSVDAIVTFQVNGDINDFGEAKLQAVRDGYLADSAVAASLSAEQLAATEVRADAGSVNLNIQTPMSNTDHFNSYSSQVATSFNNLAKINSALGVDALNVPVIAAQITYGDDDNLPVILGGAIGGTLGGLCLIGVVLFMLKRNRQKVEA